MGQGLGLQSGKQSDTPLPYTGPVGELESGLGGGL